MNTVEIKEYDTLRISGEYASNTGVALSLTGIVIQSAMRSVNNEHTYILGIEIVDAALGRFVLTSTATRLIPGLYKVDVSFLETASSKRVTSETFNVNVSYSVTVPSGVVA